MANARTVLVDSLKSWLTRSPLAPVAYAADEWRWYWRGRLRGSFAQQGEDRWILDHLGDRPGIYIDVGANYPVKISNTYLLYRRGWRGLTIEPLPRLSARHRRWRPRDIHINAACGKEAASLEFCEMWPGSSSTFDVAQAAHLVSSGRARLIRKYPVEVIQLRDLIARHFPGQVIDLLSVDTEGHDYEVLQGIDWATTRPRLIVVEVSAAGREDDRAAKLLEDLGYQHRTTIACNSFFGSAD